MAGDAAKAHAQQPSAPGSYVCDHDEADEEADDADGKEQDLTPVADVEEGRVQVWNRSGESFQAYELTRRQSNLMGKFPHLPVNFGRQCD